MGVGIPHRLLDSLYVLNKESATTYLFPVQYLPIVPHSRLKAVLNKDSNLKHVVLLVDAEAQPFVEPIFAASVGEPSSAKPPSRISNAAIMGICTVVVLFVTFVVVAVVTCTWKEAEREIDLSRPLILTEEVGKKKKKKSGKAKKQAVDEEELVPMATGDAASGVQEVPPRVAPVVSPLATDPKTNPTPPSTSSGASSPQDMEEHHSSTESTSDDEVHHPSKA